MTFISLLQQLGEFKKKFGLHFIYVVIALYFIMWLLERADVQIIIKIPKS